MAIETLKINLAPSNLYGTIQNVCVRAGDYFGQGTSAEQNYLHSYSVSGGKCNGTIQALFSDLNNYKASNNLDIINSTETNYKHGEDLFRNFAHDNGFGVNVAQNAYNSASFSTVTKEGAAVPGAFSINAFSNSQIESLVTCGQCVGTTGETVYVSSDEQKRLSNLVSARNEEITKNHLINGSTSEQMQGYEQLRNLAKQNLDSIIGKTSQSTRDLFGGQDIAKMCNKDRLKACDSLLKDKTLSDDVRAEIEQIKNSSTILKYAGVENTSITMTARQSHGWQAIGQNYLGSDMMKGINFYMAGSRIATRGIRAISRSLQTKGLNIARNTSQSKWVRGIVEKAAPKSGLNALDKLNYKQEKRREYLKDRLEASKKGKRSLREFDREHRKNTRNAKDQRTIARNKAQMEKNKGNKARVDRLGERNERIQKRNEKMNRRFDRKKERRERRTEFFKNFKKRWDKTLIGRFSRGIASVINFGAKIKRTLILGAGGFFLTIIVLFMILPLFFYIIIHFLSEPTNLTGALDSLNYDQYIVDSMNQNLSKALLKTAKQDGQTYYFFNGAKVPSDGLEWNKSISNSEIGTIYDEYGNEISSLNANLLPILAMSKMRYEDLFDFKNHTTPMAYSYYMYVNSHTALDHHYKVIDNCDNSALFSLTRFYDSNNQRVYFGYYTPVTRSEGWTHVHTNDSYDVQKDDFELCENIYIHGYPTLIKDEDLAKALVDSQAKFETTINKICTGIRNLGYWLVHKDKPEEEVVIFTSSKIDGLWLEIPYDKAGTCNNYRAYRYSNDLYTKDKGGSCPGYEHTHSEQKEGIGSCWKWVDTSWDETTVGAEGAVSQTQADELSAEGYAWNKKDKVWSKTEHHEDGYWELKCNKEEHTHSAWNSESDPGCYQTCYLCMGHCGGHISSVTDIEVMCDIDNLKNLDIISLPASFTGETSFLGIATKLITMPNIASWKFYWNAKAVSWFSPLPNPLSLGAYESLGRQVIYFGAEGIDLISANIAAMIEDPKKYFSSEHEHTETYERLKEEHKADAKDKFGFKGWSDDIVDEFKGLYGTYDELDNDNVLHPYLTGEEMFKDVEELTIPIGGKRPLTESQISSIMSQIEVYPLTDKQRSILEEALHSVGKYFYEETAEAQTKGATLSQGRSNGSGFVSGIINRATGSNLDYNYNDFCKNTFNLSNIQPGDVLVKNNSIFSGGTWSNNEENRIAIYLGGMNLKVDNYNEGTNLFGRKYVVYMDENGATIGAIKIDDFEYYYRP